MAATYEVHIDWGDDGSFATSGDDVSSRAMSWRQPITIERGRDNARAMSPPMPGRGGLLLNNTSGDYSPANTGSPLAGNVRTGLPVRIQATLGGNTYVLQRGWLDDYTELPGINDQSVQLSTFDVLGYLQTSKLSTAVHHSVRTGQAINLVLDAVGWPADDRDIDDGANTIRWWWEEGTTAAEAIRRIVQSEGMPAIVYTDDDGQIVFRDRHHRLLRSASLTSQATFRGTGTEPVHSDPITVEHGAREIVNAVLFDVQDRSPTGSAQVVWTSDRVWSVADGETVEVNATMGEPVIEAMTPVAGTDYQLRSGSVAVSLTRTSGAAITLRITASGGAAMLDGLQLRAFPLEVARRVKITATDSVSIGLYGHRTFPLDAPWLNANDAVGVAEVILAHRADRLPVVTITVEGENDTRLTQQLVRELSDRITVVADRASINNEFFVEKISHTIQAPHHATVFGCEQVATQVDNVFRFDVAGQGFDDGKFGIAGLDDPDLIFRFDTAGQGFNDGVFAT